MNIALDLRSDRPITQQLVEQIHLLIVGGILKPGDQLPTVRALASELGVSFNTIARCYRKLDEIGMISTQRGRGTYVLVSRSFKASERIRQDTLDALANRYLADALRLGCNKSQAITNLRNQRKRSDG